MTLQKQAEHFAQHEFEVAQLYTALETVETNHKFKSTLGSLVVREKEDFSFWKKLGNKENYSVSKYKLTYFKLVRQILGLSFTIKLLERRERFMIKQYQDYRYTVSDSKLKQDLDELIKSEMDDEKILVDSIEEQNSFMSSIVLGLNDGLIELTGALTGFTFALQGPKLIALAGLITGISASLSMASSSYQQARYEKGKEPKKAAFYTGITYFVVVLMLVAPYLFPINPIIAMTIMLTVGVAIVAAASFYSAVLYERGFLHQFAEMLATSLGVAGISFVIGLVMRRAFGISI